MNGSESNPTACEAALRTHIDEWRSRHKIQEDDAVLLLLELFRIHQEHWDVLRRYDMQCLDPVRDDIASLLAANQNLCRQLEINTGLLRGAGCISKGSVVTRAAACLAALAGTLAGFLLGHHWP